MTPYDDITDKIDVIRNKKQRLLLEDAEKEGACHSIWDRSIRCVVMVRHPVC